MILLLALLPSADATPWCRTLDHLALHPPRAERSEPPPTRPQTAVPETCIDPQELADAENLDGTFDSVRITTHFAIAWDATDPAVTEAALDTYEDALERSWEVEVDELGWLAPDETENCLITVLIAALPASWGDTGGYTNVQQSGTVPFMVLNTDWIQHGDVWAETLVAHEFNHATQFAYDVFWDESDWWYWEATAEWMTDSVYDDGDTYIWSLWSYLAAPELGLESYEEYVQYGHFAFNTYLAENVDPAAPRMIWEAAGPAASVPSALDQGLSGAGESFEDAVLGYTSRVAAMDVSERQVWLDALGYFEVDPWRAHVEEYPADGDYDAHTPEALGQNFMHLGGAPGGDLRFSFAGEAEVGGASPEWGITVASVDDAGAVTHEVIRADASGGAEVVISGLGVDLSDVYIGVVPMGDIGTNAAAWSWSAEVVKPTDTDEVVDEEQVACGCTSGNSRGAGLGGLILALGWARGRRDPRRISLLPFGVIQNSRR